MTRRKLNRYLRRITFVFLTLFCLAFYCKFSGDPVYIEFHNFIKDMSLLLATLAAAYLGNIFQKRTVFLQSLREEWQQIVDTKSQIMLYLTQDDTNKNDYIATYHNISTTIDYMRIVYKNVGENKKYIGYYPYEPLHDMRRIFQSIAPHQLPTIEDKKRAKKEIVTSFLALRERFVDEFDLEEPTHPIIEPNSQRSKIKGVAGFQSFKHFFKKKSL